MSEYTKEQLKELRKLDSKLSDLSNKHGFWGCLYKMFSKENGWNCVSGNNMVYQTEGKKIFYGEELDSFNVSFYDKDGKLEYKMAYNDVSRDLVTIESKQSGIGVLVFIIQQCWLFVNDLPLMFDTGNIKKRLVIEKY